MADTKTTPFPVSTEDLTVIANQACEQTLGSAEKYQHEQAGQWNQEIINTILKSLMEATSGSSPYKYVVNSTIIQHHSGASETNGASGGRRGMHSAVGAYWNAEKDGMWSHRWDGAEAKGMDVVVSDTWIAL